jgi:hypothetical protein
LASLTPAQQKLTSAQAQALTQDRQVLDEVKKHAEVMKNLTYLSDEIGARLTGSESLKRANEWTAEKMRSYGLANVHLEPWTIPLGWQRGRASAHLVEPASNSQPLTLASMGWMPGTSGKVVGPVVILPDGSASTLAAYKGKLKNAVLLLSPPANVGPVAEADFPFSVISPPPHRSSPARQRNLSSLMMSAMLSQGMGLEGFRKEGVAALLLDAGKPYGLLSTAGAWHGQDRSTAETGVALAMMGHEHYAMLYRLASRSAPTTTRIELEIQNKFIPGPLAVYNTAGEIVGSEKAEEFVVVGAHLDSWDLGQGTTDNGTGSMIVLEAARALVRSGVRPKRTIRFILFSGEEQGLCGSRAYVQQHKAEMPRVSLCLVHDTGTGRVVALGTQGRKPLQPILESELMSLKAIGLTEINTSHLMGSDHQSFEFAGVPGLALQQDMTEYFLMHHSQADTLDKAHEADLVQGAQVMAVTALRVANLPHLLPRDRK